MTWFILWTAMVAAIHHMPPQQPLAVMHVESRTKSLPFRFGRLGHTRYWGPGGINAHCFPQQPERYDSMEANVVTTIKVLAKLSQHLGFWQGLHRYNTAWNPAYAQAIKQTIREFNND